MEIRKIKIGTEFFYQVCDYVEENINRENLYRNGGTLNYSNLTYNSDILFIAFDGETPVGYNSIVRYDGGLYIYQLAIKKEYQNKGIGSALLKKAVEIAVKEKVMVTAHIMNYNSASQKMALGLGFKKVGEDLKTGNGFYAFERKK